MSDNDNDNETVVQNPWNNMKIRERKFTPFEAMLHSIVCGGLSVMAYKTCKINYTRLKNSVSVGSFIKQRPKFGTGLIAVYTYTIYAMSSANRFVKKCMKNEDIDIEF